MSFHADEDCIGMNELLTNENTEQYADDIKELLSQYYTWDAESEEFDETAPDNYREYRIKAVFEDEICDDDYTTVLYIDVKLPTDDAARELADTIDGTVISGLQDGKLYRITYRNEIYIRAKNEEEARKEFEKLSCSELASQSNFVETVSVEEQNENKET